MNDRIVRHLRRVKKHGGWLLVSLFFLWLTRQLIPEAALRSGNDVGGNWLQTFGGMYGVIVAFAIYLVWTQHNDTQAAIEKEATSLVELYRVLGWFPSWPERDAVRASLKAYARGVPPSYNDGPPMEERRLLEQGLGAFLTHSPSNPAEERLFQTAVDRFHELNEARGHRTTVARMRMGEGMRWFVFIGGGLTVAGLELLWVDSFAMHAAFVAGMTWVVVAAASIVIDLDDPTSGDFVVDWSHFADAAASMELAHCPAPHPSRP
jgi:hypothetical protein